MNQTKLESLLEVVMNISIGYVVAISITLWIVVPIWAPQWTFGDSFTVTMIHTVAAIARGYIVRRFFNAGLHKAAHNIARRLLR